MNSLIIVVILFGGFLLSHGEKVRCLFRDIYFGCPEDIYTYSDWYSMYSCDVETLPNPHNDKSITGYTGNHNPSKNDLSVKGLWVHDKNTKYIPANIGHLFNLTAFAIYKASLVEVKAENFHEMEDLEYLDLRYNRLAFIPTDALNSLKKLKYLLLSENRLQEFFNGAFTNNINLQYIHLDLNDIRFFGPTVFDGLTKLKSVVLASNICVSSTYERESGINHLKNEIKTKCVNPNSIETLTLQQSNKVQCCQICDFVDERAKLNAF